MIIEENDGSVASAYVIALLLLQTYGSEMALLPSTLFDALLLQSTSNS